ncbi:hypothetical protein GCM10017559_80160 [Streptosporangium longisporum]|uniref:Uncharacterized protein n=1 Tax=Streptosporangium longisporum TaxID=46187 RepID=A0ABP6LHI4_9ACTN
MRGGGGSCRLTDDRADPRLAEDQLGPLVGVVGVDRHVGRSRGEHRDDRDVQADGARGDPHPDPVAAPDPGGPQPLGHPPGLGPQAGVVQAGPPVVEGGRVGVTPGRLVEDVQQRPGPWRVGPPEERSRWRGDVGR